MALDFLGESEAGELVLVDNKSRDLKPRSNRKRPTAKDTELDDMLRQLYLYSIPVFESFGRYPDWLCFNYFRSGVFIKERFYSIWMGGSFCVFLFGVRSTILLLPTEA